MVPASLQDQYVIRYCVCAQNTTEADIDHAFDIISQCATDILEVIKMDIKKDEKVENKEKVENQSVEEVIVFDRKKKMSLKTKRSFFVQLVSDPKLYNPKVSFSDNSSNSIDNK